MRRVQDVPGAIGAGGVHTLPTGSPPMRSVISAEIWHLPIAMGIPANHVAAAVVAAIDDHPVHAHDLDIGGAVAAGAAIGASVGTNDMVNGAGTVIPEGGATGVQSNAAAQAHAATAVPIVHAGGPGPANPILATTATRVSDTTFTLNQNTILGDELVIFYNEVGEWIRPSV